MDRICNDFLWGEKDAKKKIHLVGKTATFLPKDLGGLGIRAHKDLSIIYMARLGWKMSQGPPNLAQDCIRSKYIQNDKVTTFNNGSKTWKNIGVGWDLLQQNKVWQIGDGKDISFWEDNWLGIGSIRSLLCGPLKHNEISMKLRDLRQANQWQLHLLSMPIPDFILSRILETKIPVTHEQVSDRPFSSFVVDDKFSLTMAYQAITKNRKNKINLDWLWKGNMPPKLKIFL